MLGYTNEKQGSAFWQDLLANRIETAEELEGRLGLKIPRLREIIRKYPMRISPHYLSLIKEKNDPIYKQCVPDPAELEDDRGLVDPLAEERFSPLPGLTRRYPDRVLFLVSDQCATYCRFCNRKRKVGRRGTVTKETIQEGLRYIKAHKEVRDVLLSGGDPLLLETPQLETILRYLRDIPHVQIIRIGTRVPCVLPQRVTPSLVSMLKKYHPLYINTHFNHPKEITPESAKACSMLADAGIPLGCQTVLLRGVNDSVKTIKQLMEGLVRIRARPYYLFQADQARGTAHFWTPLDTGLEIISALQGNVSGLCIPHFCVDLPGGGGKVLLTPESIQERQKDALIIKNFEGELYEYPIYS